MTEKLLMILGVAYIIALLAFGIYTATIRPWCKYVAGIIVFLLVLFATSMLAMQGADGPDGFAVGLVFGSMFWLAVLAHIVRWLRVLVVTLWQLLARQRKAKSSN
ncbi:hypothetical protein [Methylomonas sp. HYX-M1]|uniref:hypothetical protein n=1 Tax=Methylomonas sp. HYX-M1 TaxID=3139307 RepID=UPI00345C17CD